VNALECMSSSGATLTRMTSTARRRSGTTSWPLAVTLAALCILPVIGMAFTQHFDGRENVAYQCAMLPDLPAGALHAEVSLQGASVTSMPAGRLCTFSAADGGTVSIQTGWPTTIAGLVASVLATAFSAFALRVRGERGKLTTLVPVAVIALIWAMVLLSAHTVSM